MLRDVGFNRFGKKVLYFSLGLVLFFDGGGPKILAFNFMMEAGPPNLFKDSFPDTIFSESAFIYSVSIK